MSNKSLHFPKLKFTKKKSSPKSSSESVVSSSLYSGVASAERAIQNPRIPSSIHSNQLKHLGEKVDAVSTECMISVVKHHIWKSKYNQVFTREKMKRSMTKNPYTPIIHLIAHANECITTEEECSPVLITADAVCIEKPVVLIGKIKTILPNIVRYVRNKEAKTSDRYASQFSMKKSSISQLQIETNTPLPMIGTNKSNSVATNLVTTDRLLNRAKMRNDSSVLQRSARISVMDTIHETISQLSVYG